MEDFVLKHKLKIENARDRDWKTYAECANAFVSKRICNAKYHPRQTRKKPESQPRQISAKACPDEAFVYN